MLLTDKQQLFEQHYSDLFDSLYRYIYTRVPNVCECEDIVSDVILSGYRQLDKFNPVKGSLEQWLIGSARYHIIDYWKKQRFTLELDEAILLCDAVAQDTSLTDQVHHKFIFNKIMEHLPPAVQALLTLRYIDGLTYQEIAEVTNQPPATVRKFFSRLHQKLREQFNELHYA